MIYNIKKIDDQFISHQLINKKTGEVTVLGTEDISTIENLKEHLQDWITQRKQVLNIKFVKNDFGFKLKQDQIVAQLKDTTINDSGFLRLPRGTTAERPTLVGSSPGMVRFNTTTQTPEWYDDALSGWFPLGFIAPLATGGTITNIAQNGINYRVHTFLSSGTFTASRSGTVEFLIIGGGGAGGGNLSGGGGAGGVLMGSIAVQDGTAYPIIVGDGGARFSSSEVNSQSGGQSNKGRPSSAFNLVAAGGGVGGGGSSGIEATAGASGGGGGGYQVRAAVMGLEGQGHAGGKGATNLQNYRAGGGGGAGGPGGDWESGMGRGGQGGPGIASSIEGSIILYAGGGGGGSYTSNTGGGLGGIGGGGGGGTNSASGGPGGAGRTNGGNGYGNNLGAVASSLPTGGNGGANTGSGGGGVGHQTALSGAGGSGIVVIRYKTSSVQYLQL